MIKRLFTIGIVIPFITGFLGTEILAAIYFEEMKDTIKIGNQYYELSISKKDGSFIYLEDKLNNEVVVMAFEYEIAKFLPFRDAKECARVRAIKNRTCVNIQINNSKSGLEGEIL